LTGLNDQFSIVKTQVLLLDPLPSLNKLYSILIQEESNNSSPSSISIFEDNASEARKPQGCGKGSYSNSHKPSRYCTFCYRNNHTIDFCYQKHVHPSFPK